MFLLFVYIRLCKSEYCNICSDNCFVNGFDYQDIKTATIVPNGIDKQQV